MKSIKRPYLVAGLFVVWIAAGLALNGRWTLAMDASQQTPLQLKFGSIANSIDANRHSNPLFVYFFNPLRSGIDHFTNFIRAIISLPSGHNVIPILGWAGVVALIGYVVFLTSNWKMAFIAIILTSTCGALGLWSDTAESLSLTLAAVTLSLLIGLPVGIWAGISDRGLQLVTPLLDFAQIMPTFVYLTPLTLVFLIGPAAAVITTMIYAIPPVIRITAHGIRHVPTNALEAAVSQGSTKAQLLRKVQVPLARETIIVGVNQCVMAAFSMITIAAFIDAPGLGGKILLALQTLNVGAGFVAGLAIVLLAIMLDRSATAAGAKAKSFVPPTEQQIRIRRIGIVVGGVATAVVMYLSRTVIDLAVFPSNINIGKSIENATNSLLDFITKHLYFLTDGFQNFITVWAINPLEKVLAESPWFVTLTFIVLLAAFIGGTRPAIVAFIAFGATIVLGLWNDSMLTLTQVLVATGLTMIIGIALGVWIGRSKTADRFWRPILDAGQTLPAFVFLVPLLGLFGGTRFTAIAAAVVYAAPIVVKLVADGIRNVPVSMIEAATSAGSTSRQMITKVQIPASRKSIALGINQGLIYVLAMVVVGGLVGGQALGYDVVNGFAQLSLTGKGLAAGLAIVSVGIGLDRISQFGARRGTPEERI